MIERSVTKKYIRIFIVIIFLISPILAYAEVNIVETEAGKAFKAKDYGKALVEFNKLLETEPDNTLILRYIGITYHKLGDYPKAVETFEKALKLEPDNAAIHYYLGTTYFKMENAQKARESFLNAITLAPDTLYSEWSNLYIQAMEQQESRFERPGDPQRWNIFIQIAPQYDSNVPQDPDSGGSFSDDGSFRFTEYASLSHRTKRFKNWTLGTEVSSYLNQHTNSESKDFNLVTINTNAYINYTTNISDKIFSPNLVYNFNYVLLDYDSFSKSHSITALLNTILTQNTLTVPFYRLSFDNFNNEGFNPSISSRDAVSNAFGITQYYFFLDRSANVWASYNFETNDADGLNFNYNAHEISAGASFPIRWQLRGILTAAYGHEDYPDFQGPRDRRTNRQNYFVQLSRQIKGPVYTSVSYQFINENSNYDVLEFDRHIIGWSVFISY